MANPHKSGLHLAGCVHLWCFRGSMVTSLWVRGLSELADDDWDYRTTAWNTKRMHAHTQPYFIFLVCQWLFWTSMTNALWTILPLFLCDAPSNFPLVRQSHIIIQPHGNLSLSSRGKYDSSSSPLLPLTVVSVVEKQSLVPINLSRHVCNASSTICCGCWFLHGLTVYTPRAI